MRVPLKAWGSPLASKALKSLLPLGLILSATASSSAQIGPRGLKEMNEIYAFKATLTPAEQKMSTVLVLASRAASGKPLGIMSRFSAAPKKDDSGQVLVDVLGYATPALLKSASVGSFDTVDGHAPSATYQHTHLRAHVRANQLTELAAHSDVTSLREVTGYHTNAGSITSQGYVSTGANKVVAAGTTGAGIKVGVLSDSASAARVAALIASGDLPANTVVLPNQAGPTAAQGGEDEGAAMMEIVHDIAPGAQIFFATGEGGQGTFAANIQALRFTYGCDIIVDDLSYFAESVFQDGTVAQAVNTVTADGALYFSAAANSGNLSSGTSGTWEGDFTPFGTLTTAKGVVTLNNFGTVGSPSNVDQLTSAASSGVWLHWADPNAASTNDYDLFIYDSTGATVKCSSVGAQTGTQDPLEYCYPGQNYTSAVAGDLIVVTLAVGTPRGLHIDTERATVAIGTSGATFGHNAGPSTFTAAAVYWNAAHIGAKIFTGGASNPDETFSSDGPRKLFFNPDGTPITAGNYLFGTNGGKTYIKPDAAGPDGNSAATPGFNPFFGTSAAAPHLAGVAALVKSANPALTNTQIRNIMTSTALDNMATGIDRDSGYGIVNAPAAVAAAKAMITK